MTNSKKIWLITGVSRGFGKALAQAVLDQGDIVIGTTRSGTADLSGDANSLKLFELELTNPAQIKQTVEAAYQLHGRLDVVVNNAGYGLMGAVEAVSQALAQEVEPLGIKVTLVEPGVFRTDFLSDHSLVNSQAKIADYQLTSGKVMQHLADIAGKQLGDPNLGAQAILKAVESENPPLHLVLGSDALKRTRAKLEAMTKNLDAWEAVSKSTDFQELATTA